MPTSPPEPLATRDDLVAFGLPAGWLTGILTGDQDAALMSATRLALSYLGSRFGLPITAWGEDVRMCVAHIASWFLMARKGYNPESPNDQIIRTRYEDAVAWFKGVVRGDVTPTGVSDSTVAVLEGDPDVFSDEPRGL